jgi:hypothetical protein
VIAAFIHRNGWFVTVCVYVHVYLVAQANEGRLHSIKRSPSVISNRTHGRFRMIIKVVHPFNERDQNYYDVFNCSSAQVALSDSHIAAVPLAVLQSSWPACLPGSAATSNINPAPQHSAANHANLLCTLYIFSKNTMSYWLRILPSQRCVLTSSASASSAPYASAISDGPCAVAMRACRDGTPAVLSLEKAALALACAAAERKSRRALPAVQAA